MSKLFMAVVLLGFSACSVDRSMKPFNLDAPANPSTPTPASKPVPLTSTELSFKNVNENIFKTSCVGCHSQAGGNKGKVNLESFEEVSKHAHEIRLEVSGGTMPPKEKLSEDQIKLVLDWIDAGAKELADVKVQPSSSAVVMEKVIKTNCLQCHSEKGGNKGHVNLENYDSIFLQRLDVASEINDGSMPPKDGIPLTNDQKNLILTWITQGAKP